MFRGHYEHTLDSKGRVSLPARLREALVAKDGTPDASRFVLTCSLYGCLVIYTWDRWLSFEARIAALAQFNPQVQRLKRVYIAGAVECTLDGHGRLLVPETLRKFAELERDVVWVGQLDTMELWSLSRWKTAVEEAMDDPQSLAQAIADLGL
jgi:MraZ protein